MALCLSFHICCPCHPSLTIQIRDIVTRIIRQLSNIIMDAAESSMSLEQGSHHTCFMARALPLMRQHQRQLKRAGLTETAAAAAAAAAGAPIPLNRRAAGLSAEELAEAERNIINSHIRTEASALGEGAAFGARAPTAAAAAAAAVKAAAKNRSCGGRALEGGGLAPDRPSIEYDERERHSRESAKSILKGTEMGGGGGGASEAAFSSRSYHFHQDSFYRLTSTLNVALHCTLRQWAQVGAGLYFGGWFH